MSEEQVTEAQVTEAPVQPTEGPKQVFLNLPIEGYPYPLTIIAHIDDTIRLHLATIPEDQVKKMTTTIVMNMLSDALAGLGLAIGVPDNGQPKEEKSSLILPG
jgi:hypothetical protein